MNKKLQIAIIGSAGAEEYSFGKPSKLMYAAAEELGKNLAMRGAMVVTGGKGGIMEAACRGARQAGGITVAEIANADRYQANNYVDVEVVTCDAGFRGPSQLVGMSDGLIALGGGVGTLQELCVAYRMAKPVVLLTGFGGWVDRVAAMEYLDERRTITFVLATSVVGAVQELYDLLQSKTKDTQ